MLKRCSVKDSAQDLPSSPLDIDVFVHDYNSSRVGVGLSDGWMSTPFFMMGYFLRELKFCLVLYNFCILYNDTLA